MTKEFDLEERTAVFAEKIIDFSKTISRSEIYFSLIHQLIRSATSIGSNYREANGASSKKDFKNAAQTLWQEAFELTKIFSKIVFTMNKNYLN